MVEPAVILAKLDELVSIRDATAHTRAAYTARRTAILASVQAELDALAAEFAPLLQTADTRMAALEDEIKALVRAYGQSVKTPVVSVSYSKPRVKWDTTRLDGFAAAHPEILQFRSEAPPVVALRWRTATPSVQAPPATTRATDVAATADDADDVPF